MFKYNDFLNENVEQAKSYLRSIDVPETDPLYVGIRELTKGKDGYVGWLTKMAYGEFKGRGTSQILTFIGNLLKMIVNDKQIIDLLDKPVIQYESYEKFIDAFEQAKLLFKAKKIYNELPKRQKDLLDINDINVISLLSKLYDDKTNNVFLRKISSYKTKDELVNGIKRFLEGGSTNNDFDKILDNLEQNKLPLIYADETNNLIIARIMDYNQCRTVGSKTSWCIARDSGTFNSYVRPKTFDRQYIIYLTDLPITNDNRIIGVTYKITGFSTAHNVIDSYKSESDIKKILSDRDFNIDKLKINIKNLTQEDIDNNSFGLLLNVMSYEDILKNKNRYKDEDISNIKKEDIEKFNILDKTEIGHETLKKFNREDFFSKNLLDRLIPDDDISIFDFIECGLTKEDILKNKKQILSKITDEENIKDFNWIIGIGENASIDKYKYGGYYKKTYDVYNTIDTLKFYSKTKENGVTLNDLESILVASYSDTFRVIIDYLKYAKFDDLLNNRNSLFNFFVKIYKNDYSRDIIDMINSLYDIGYKYPDKLKEYMISIVNDKEEYYSSGVLSEYYMKYVKKILGDDQVSLTKIEQYNKINKFKQICLYLSGTGKGLDYREYKDITMEYWIRDWMEVGLDAYDYKTGYDYNRTYDWIISYIILLVYNNKFDLLPKIKMDWTLGKNGGYHTNGEDSLLYKIVGTIMDLRYSNSERKVPLAGKLTETQRYKVSEWLMEYVFNQFDQEDKDKLESSILLLYFAYDRIKMNEYIDKIKKDKSSERMRKLDPLIVYLINDRFEKTSYYKTGRFDRYIDLNYILNRFTTNNKTTKGDNKIMTYNCNWVTDNSQCKEIIKKYFVIEPKPKNSGWESKVYNYTNFINEKVKNDKKYKQFNESKEKGIEIDKKNHKFQLISNGDLVSESGFVIEQPDKWFNEPYVTIHDFKTFENFQGKGFAKYLLEQIFDYVKNELKLNIITLIVYKDNYKAVNLYFKCGFEIYVEYDDSYSLIKKL